MHGVLQGVVFCGMLAASSMVIVDGMLAICSRVLLGSVCGAIFMKY